jgi:hypothetical protein
MGLKMVVSFSFPFLFLFLFRAALEKDRGRAFQDLPGRQSPYYLRAGDCGVTDRDHILQLSLEDTVEVFRASDRDQGV